VTAGLLAVASAGRAVPAAAGLLAAGGAGLTPLWYTTRATGVVALGLLTGTVVLGVAGVTRFASPRLPRLVTSGLHRNLSLTAVAFLAAHIATALLDTYAPVGLASVLLPFASSYRPFWLGLGTLAFDLVLALVVTSLLRARLRYRSWKLVHWAAYAAWPLALWHGLGTGTDGRLPWLLAIDAACVLAVLAALWWRLSVVGIARQRSAVVLASLALTLATAVFVVAGPLEPGWARRAGTPAALLSHSGAGPAGAPAGGAGGRTAARTGTATAASVTSGAFAGTIVQSGSGQNTTLTITASGPSRQHIVIALHGRPGDDGGIALSSGRVTVSVPGHGGTGHPAVYGGPVTSLDGSLVGAVLTGPQGGQVPVRMSLAITGPHVTGRLDLGSGGDS
jgi:Ferric reductase like transmembrane component